MSGLTLALGLGAALALVDSGTQEMLQTPTQTEPIEESTEPVVAASDDIEGVTQEPVEPPPEETNAPTLETDTEVTAEERASPETSAEDTPQTAEAEADRASRARAAAQERRRRDLSMARAEDTDPSERTVTEVTEPERTAPNMARLGTLRINSRPWSTVSIMGGRRLGNTPLVVQLPAGSYNLRLHNSEARITETYSVRIRAGEVTARTISIGSGSR